MRETIEVYKCKACGMVFAVYIVACEHELICEKEVRGLGA